MLQASSAKTEINHVQHRSRITYGIVAYNTETNSKGDTMATNEFNKKVHDVVLSALKRTNRIPYLFVGSGISRRYMGTESWNNLLEWVCNTVGAPMRKYAIYKQMIKANDYDDELGPNPAIASSMEVDFLNALENESLAEWTKKHNSDIYNIPAMKLFIADHLRNDFSTRLMTDELKLLKKATRSIAGIITTNYDTLMEELFSGYKIYEEQDDLLFTQFTGIGEIYKIHGSINHPESMILDAKDYIQFNKKAKYLIAKILTIFGEYPVIFLGYSISDPDVRKIIRAIADCAGPKRISEMENRFIFVDYSQDKSTITPSLIDVGKSVSMITIKTNDFSPIYSAITEMKQRYTPRVISQFRRQVFVGTSTSEEAEKMLPVAWSELDSLPQDTPVVVGLDQRDYGKPICYEELYEDLLFNNKAFNADLIIGAYMDDLLKKNPSGLPMYKYLLSAKTPVTGEKIRQNIKEYRCYDAYLSSSNKKDRARYRKRLKEENINGLISAFGKETAFKHLTCLYEAEIDSDSLYNYLREVACFDVPEDRRSKLKSMLEDSDMRRCIRIYDYLTYGKQFLNKNSASTVTANSVSPSDQEKHLTAQ